MTCAPLACPATCVRWELPSSPPSASASAAAVYRDLRFGVYSQSPLNIGLNLRRFIFSGVAPVLNKECPQGRGTQKKAHLLRGHVGPMSDTRQFGGWSRFLKKNSCSKSLVKQWKVNHTLERTLDAFFNVLTCRPRCSCMVLSILDNSYGSFRSYGDPIILI